MVSPEMICRSYESRPRNGKVRSKKRGDPMILRAVLIVLAGLDLGVALVKLLIWTVQ